MDRTLRACTKFESSNLGLILGTQITPRGWIFWTIIFNHQKIQVKIYLMRGQTFILRRSFEFFFKRSLLCFDFLKFSDKKICQRSNQNWRLDCNPKKVKARSFSFQNFFSSNNWHLEKSIYCNFHRTEKN